MNTTTISSFPKSRVARAAAELSKAYARAVRNAKRQGAEVPGAPSLEVTNERRVWKCSDCGASETVDPIAHGRACEGTLRYQTIVDLVLTAPRPRLDGWEFLAVVEPLATPVPGAGRNLIRQVPGAEIADGELAPLRDADMTCDHCHAHRRRAETFVVRNAEGAYRQVGRQCLAAFLGGKSAAAIIAALAYPTIVRGIGDGDGGGWGGGDDCYDPAEFLAWTAASVRIAGWLSRTAARGMEKQATADHVQYLLTPQTSSEGYARWKRAREEFAPTDEDKAHAAAALAWAKALTTGTDRPLSDYEQNLLAVAHQVVLEPKHAGILASALPGYLRVLGAEVARRKRAEQPSSHLGTVGAKRFEFGRVVLERVFAIDTQYGALHIHTFRDAAGNAIVWKTSEAKGAPGAEFTLTATIKEHGEYKGEKQTNVTRARLDRVVAEEASAA